jgi:hypothetical protein
MTWQINPETGEEYDDGATEERWYLGNIAEPTREAIKSGGYSRVGYIPTTWEDREEMASYAGEDPSAGVVDSEKFMIEDSHLPMEGGKRVYGIPPKPSDEELALSDAWEKFKPKAKKIVGVDPEAEYKKAQEEWDSNFDNVDLALFTPDKKMKFKQDKEKFASSRRAAAEREQAKEMTSLRGLFAKQWESKQKAIAKAPTGYRETEDGSLEAIPGGPADIKQQTALTKDTSALEGIVSDVSRLGQVAKQLKDHPGLSRITGIMGKVPNIPGSDAANAEALLGTLKSQTAFSVLQTMRNNSKTGGALGQVSDKECELLEDNLAALDKAQSYKAYQAALQKIIDYTDGSISRAQKAYDTKWGEKKTKQTTTEKTVVKKFISKSTGKTKYVYSDGTEEIK